METLQTDRKTLAKFVKLEIIPNEERKSNNDPISSKKFDRDLEFLQEKIKIVDSINKHGFKLKFSDIFCKCSKKIIEREIFFSNACSLYFYYLDITTYFKKMMEVDIIKFFLFTKSERSLISIISNPDIPISENLILGKLNSQYKDYNHENFETKIDLLLKDVLMDARDRKDSNKLFQLIQNGNNVVLDY